MFVCVVVIVCSRLQALVVNYVEIQMLRALFLSLSLVAFRCSQLFLIVVVAFAVRIALFGTSCHPAPCRICRYRCCLQRRRRRRQARMIFSLLLFSSIRFFVFVFAFDCVCVCVSQLYFVVIVVVFRFVSVLKRSRKLLFTFLLLHYSMPFCYFCLCISIPVNMLHFVEFENLKKKM